MPWSPEKIEEHFDGRLESCRLTNGVIGRVQMSPIIAVKSKHDIANSTDECIYGNFVITGELKVEQCNKVNFAKPGDLILHQSVSPVTLTTKNSEAFSNIALLIPTTALSNIPEVTDMFSNVLLRRDTITGPLLSCLEMIGRGFHAFTYGELSAVFDACVALIPLASGCFGPPPDQLVKPDNPKMRDILGFIEQNLSDPELSPTLI
jgi:AraC family transcriptional activator of tynA and feaB